MVAYSPTHIRIPKNHADFESKSVILFRLLLEDPGVKKLGRSGQKQFGIDLIGYRKQNLKRLVGIQCKKKKPGEKLTLKEVRDEVKKALKCEPRIFEYIIVTTAEDDRALDQLAQQLTRTQREKGRKFRVQVWGWGTLEELIDQHEEAKDAFDPGASPSVKAVKANLAFITKKQRQQATAQQVAELSRKIDSQGAALTSDQLPTSVADKEIDSEIRILLARRGFPEAKPVEEWARLAERTLTGDLVKASPTLRSDVLERAARSHARPEDAAKAKAFHAAACKCNRQLDTRFFDALLPLAEGDANKTLRALRKLATPEAKSAIFIQLYRSQGAKAALDWLVASQIVITDLDAAGALNVLLQKVETDDFDGALKDAESLTADQLHGLPSLYTVRCSLLLASALPKDLKRLPFQGMPIDPRALRFASTPQAATALAKARVDLDFALNTLESLRIIEVRPFLEEMALWLRLEDKQTHDAAVERIAKEIKDPAKTLRRVRLALSYSIPFNRDALMRSLVAQRKIGNWDVDEQFAVFLLAFYSDDLSKTVEFFDSYGADLYSHDSLPKGLLLGVEVEALARIGRFEDARERLSRHKGRWVDNAAAAHLEDLIASVETGKEAERLRGLYEKKKDLNFLRLLVHALTKEPDSHQLTVYAPLLLQETNRIEDYDTSIKALYRR